jgi:putative pyruvate formate lyase activating enzyme
LWIKDVADYSANIPIFASGIGKWERVVINPLIALKLKYIYENADRILLEHCTLCPRECGVDRFTGRTGFCGMDAGFNIASVCIHRGEEPVISGTAGICNIFFEGCNLRCLYCQNHEISQQGKKLPHPGTDPEKLLDQIEKILSDGINAVGFVSPSHVVPQVKLIIRGLNSRGLKPVTVYNTSSYDKVETLKDLSDIIDVYLPDFKYATPSIAMKYSEASDYPQVALKALKEMYYQKGSVLRVDEEGRAESGMLIRHLVLPGHIEESIKVLEIIAEELSPGVNMSLMSQYHPAFRARNHPVLNRPLLKEEYDTVANAMKKMGFRNGWLQDMDSFQNYIPDFRKDHPFEN